MDKKDCFYLGKIVRKYSFKGELVIKLDTDEPDLYKDMDVLLINLKNKLVPFIIKKSLLQKGNQLRVRFEDIESEQDAEMLLKSEVYLPLNLLPKLEGKKFYFHEIIGFIAEDESHGIIGEITGVNDSTAQPLFEITQGKKEILIPMIDNFIKEIDRENKKVLLDCPEGLIEMYD